MLTEKVVIDNIVKYVRTMLRRKDCKRRTY